MQQVRISGRWDLMVPDHRTSVPWDTWEYERIAATREVVSEGDVVWDIGAEEGDLPALWASWGARVVMAEPNQAVWPNILAIWRANALPHPAGCIAGFLADIDHGTHMLEPNSWPECALGPMITDHGFARIEERPDLPSARMDTLVDRDPVWTDWPAPDVVTMDVEGAEHLVIAGARETLLRCRPVVLMSVHPEFIQAHFKIPNGEQLVIDALDNLGYDHEWIATDHEIHYRFDPR